MLVGKIHRFCTNGNFHLSCYAIHGVLPFSILRPFTRWIAIAHKYLQKAHRDSTLFASVYAIPETHRAGLISSYVMRQAFYSKMVMYITLVIGACICDYMLHRSGGGFTISGMVIGYLSLTEFLSMIENLDEAGVSALHTLNENIKERMKF